MSDDIRCLVTGATGYIGGLLVPQLLDAGLRVRALARNPDKLADAPWRDDVEVARGDLTQPESLVEAFEGVDVVYYLVHSMGTSKDFVAEERQSAHNVVDAAKQAGVRRLVYLSGLHPEDVDLSRHLSSRTEVGEILIASGIETVVLQAGIVIGSGSASFEMIRHLTDRLPAMTTPKWVRNKIQPIAIDDILYYLPGVATADIPSSRTWDVGGPDVMEYGEAMQGYAEVAGLRRRLIVVLPFLTPTIASWWVGLVTPIPSGLARPLVESLECDAVMHNHDIDGIIAPPRRRADRLSCRRSRGAEGRRDRFQRREAALGEVQSDCAAVGFRVCEEPTRCRCRTAAECPVRAAVASMCSMTFLPSAVSPGSSIGYLPSKQAVHNRDAGCSVAAIMPCCEM